MSVWDTIVGQKPVVDMLSGIAEGDPSRITQSWLFCGPPGSGRSNLAICFAAALECPRHGCGQCDVCKSIMNRTYPDVTVVTTNTTTITIDQVRELVEEANTAPQEGVPWHIVIIEDVDRMAERTTNVLLKSIEEPAEKTMWILCAPSPADVLPTIRSRTRIVTLGVPRTADVAAFLQKTCGTQERLAKRCARLAEGHIGVARLYATDDQALADRDELVVGVLTMKRVSDAVILADAVLKHAADQAKNAAERDVERAQSQFRHLNGLADKDPIPANLRHDWNALSKKEEIKRRERRVQMDVLDRCLNSVASVYRDVAVIQNSAVDAAGLVNFENRDAEYALAERLTDAQAVAAQDAIATARARLHGNGNATLDLEALFCTLLTPLLPAPAGHA